jgi:hypothetical protein
VRKRLSFLLQAHVLDDKVPYNQGAKMMCFDEGTIFGGRG